MKLEFNQVIPHTLKDKINPQTEIWSKDVTFRKGEFTLIKAISGSGKSTFINILYGIRKDYSGDVTYDDKSIKTFSNNDFSDLRTQEISIVFQDLRLFPHLTAQENILVNSKNKNELSTYQTEQVEKLKISSLLQKKTELLSYGERQRVAIVRALSQEYSFLLLDEPFSHLDKGYALVAYEMILEDAKVKNASIIVTSLGNETFLSPDKTLML